MLQAFEIYVMICVCFVVCLCELKSTILCKTVCWERDTTQIIQIYLDRMTIEPYTFAKYSSWECQRNKRDFHKDEFNPVFSKKVRGQKHHWEVYNCRHIIIKGVANWLASAQWIMVVHVVGYKWLKVSENSQTLQWRHNGHDSVSNHQPHDCLLNRLFRRRSKKTLKLRVTGLCAGNSPGTGEFTAQMASNAENVSIWWRHYGLS